MNTLPNSFKDQPAAGREPIVQPVPPVTGGMLTFLSINFTKIKF